MKLRTCDYERVISKFQMKIRNSGDRHAWLEVDGKVVIRTKRSHHKGGDLPAQDHIRQQLKLNEEELRAAVSCQLTREDYLELLRQKHIL